MVSVRWLESRTMTRVEIEGRSLTTQRWGDGPAEIVVLHDGLGSIRQWRDLPAQMHATTGRTVLAYDRAGHGSSTPVPTGPWPADWLHTEAELLAQLLDEVAVAEPLLVGHSDGGSISLLTAAAEQERVAALEAQDPLALTG